MKFILSFFLLLSWIRPVQAEIPETSVQAYWQWSQNENESQNAESVDLCLERIYSAEADLSVCRKAVSDLTQIPLNSSRRALLFSLLKKIATVKADNFETELMHGLLRTHPELSDELPPKQVQKFVAPAEAKAWKKILFQKSDSRNVWISINGQPPALAQGFAIPQGIYQWTLLTAQYEPLVLVGTWNDFSLALKDLQPRSETSSLFPSTKPAMAMPEHLSSVPELPAEKSSEKISSRSWLVPVVLAVGVGLVLALKDKQIIVKMPGEH